MPREGLRVGSIDPRTRTLAGQGNVRRGQSPVAQRRFYCPARVRLASEIDLGDQLQDARGEVAGEAGVDPQVREVDSRRGIEEHGTGYPAVPPLVLILYVGGIGPFDDAKRDRVGAGPHEPGDVELGREVRVFAHADLDAVERRHQDALGGPDVEHDSTPGEPCFGHLEVPLVHARRVHRGKFRRIPGKWHLDVGVVRQVEERQRRVLGSRHRPAARDVDFPPVGPERLLRLVEKLEAPAAVERDSIEMGDAVHGQPVLRSQLRGEPWSCCHSIRPPSRSQAAYVRSAPPGPAESTASTT